MESSGVAGFGLQPGSQGPGSLPPSPVLAAPPDKLSGVCTPAALAHSLSGFVQREKGFCCPNGLPAALAGVALARSSPVQQQTGEDGCHQGGVPVSGVDVTLLGHVD